MHVVRESELPGTRYARELEGRDHGAAISLILVHAAPGDGPALHRHDYDEVVVVQSGRARWWVDGEERHAVAGDILVVRAGQAHRFVNEGDEPLVQVDVHASPRFVTEWLDGALAMESPETA